MSSLPKAQTDQLKAFVTLLKAKPDLLHNAELSFFREYLVSLGARIPEPQAKKTTKEEDVEEIKRPEDSKGDNAKPAEDVAMEEDTEPESDVELDMSGVVAPDNDPPQEMGDASKAELTDEESDAFDAKKSEALAAFGEGEWEKAIGLFTEAIRINAQSSVVFAKRGTCYLKLKRPNACIRDCDRAIELNPDSAPAYKFRGRAHELLGHFVEAARDLRTACKIDFDEQADEWLKLVTPNAKKLEEHERRKQRRREEKELRERQERVRKAKEANERAYKEASEASASQVDDEMGGLGGLGGLFSDPEMMEAFNDPEVSAAFMDITQNPANIMKYQNNPKIMKLMAKLSSKMGGAMPGGFPGGMPGGMGGMPGGFPGGMGGMPGGFPGGMGGFPGGSGGPSSGSGKPPSATDDLD